MDCRTDFEDNSDEHMVRAQMSDKNIVVVSKMSCWFASRDDGILNFTNWFPGLIYRQAKEKQTRVSFQLGKAIFVVIIWRFLESQNGAWYMRDVRIHEPVVFHYSLLNHGC